EQVTLEFQAACPATQSASEPCRPEGSVEFRPVDGPAKTIALRSADQKLTVDVPADLLSGKGFAYVATIKDALASRVVTVPADGWASPERVWVLTSPSTVDLGSHSFGNAREPDAIVARGAWGNQPGQFGLDTGPDQSTSGPASFDVAPEGGVVVLDQLNRRL